MSTGLNTLALAAASGASVAFILGSADSYAATVVVGLVVLSLSVSLFAGLTVYLLWLSRGRLAYSDGKGMVVFDDSSTGRAKTPAPEGPMRALLLPAEQTEGYREDGDAQRYRLRRVNKGSARVRTWRSLAGKLAILAGVLLVSALMWDAIGTTIQTHVVETSCCTSEGLL